MHFRAIISSVIPLAVAAFVFPVLNACGQSKPKDSEPARGNATKLAAPQAPAKAPAAGGTASPGALGLPAPATAHPQPQSLDPAYSLVAGDDGSGGIPGDVPALPDDVDKSINVFFGLLAKAKIDSAYDALVKDTVIATKPSDVTTLKEKTRQAVELFGAILGHQVVASEHVGSNLLRVTVISLGDLYPLRWRLYFYKSSGPWRLIDIRVDDKLGALFGETETPAPAK